MAKRAKPIKRSRSKRPLPIPEPAEWPTTQLRWGRIAGGLVLQQEWAVFPDGVDGIEYAEWRRVPIRDIDAPPAITPGDAVVSSPNHIEAFELALSRENVSNLARCYLDLRSQTYVMMGAMAKLTSRLQDFVATWTSETERGEQ